jgi:hypothetical protein
MNMPEVVYAGTNQSTSKRSQSKLPDAKYFVTQTVIDVFSPNVCILNKAGDILLVNQAWRNFYDANCDAPVSNDYFIGINYFQVCNEYKGSDATSIKNGALQVIRGEVDEFCLLYPCHSSTQKRWFNVRVTRFQHDSEHLMLSHKNITEFILIE